MSNIYRMTYCDKSYGSDGHYKLIITGVDKKLLVDTIPMYGSIRRKRMLKKCIRLVRVFSGRRLLILLNVNQKLCMTLGSDGNKIFYANGIRTFDCGEQPFIPMRVVT